MDIDENISN